jgi:cobalamin-dependent methionine synthase I
LPPAREHNNYAVDFLSATRWIKQLPHAVCGVSNVAFAATTLC